MSMAVESKVFNPLEIPTSGSILVEASAGTGKTYGIAALFLRFVLLENKSVSRLLVVTFTKAAVAELKIRLRKRLSEALQILQSSAVIKAVADSETQDDLRNGLAAAFQILQDQPAMAAAADSFMCELLAKALQQCKREDLCTCLQVALSEFDRAGIYTIHGFCRSVLNDEAFLCQVPFSLEMVESKQDIIDWLCTDFWRRRVAADAKRAYWVTELNLQWQDVLADIQPYLQQSFVYEIPENECFAEAIQNRKAIYDALQQNIHKNRLPPEQAIAAMQAIKLADKISAELNQRIQQQGISCLEKAFWQLYPKLNGNKYRANTYCLFFAELDQNAYAVLSNDKNKALQSIVKTLGQGSWDVKKNQKASDEELKALELLNQWAAALLVENQQAELAKVKLQFELLDYLQQQLAQQKTTDKERSFDDLLIDVHHAVSHQPVLVERLASSWDVLMVDEFQDTDALQYAIFKRCFIDRDIPTYLVGDPKQAIYRFRGADIHTYLKAAKEADERYSLNKQWRAHQGLINAFDALFARNNPFYVEEIDYVRVKAHRQDSYLIDLQSGKNAFPPLSVHCVNAGQTEKETVKIDNLRQSAAAAAAKHIAWLLRGSQEGRYVLKKNGVCRAVREGDIAILVRQRSEAELMQQALKKCGLQGVVLSNESIFESEEAEAITALLHYWLKPYETGYLCQVLASSLFGYTSLDIEAFNQNSHDQSHWHALAIKAKQLTEQKNFYSAYQYFNQEIELEKNLIKNNKERVLTNLFQLVELLSAAYETVGNLSELLAWLVDKDKHEKNKSDNQLRLESDEALLKIVTVHTAKGLQYPLVYCPFFLGNHKNQQKNSIEIEINKDQDQQVLKPQSQLTAPEKIAEEALAEEIRLFYVAVTRAEEALFLWVEDSEVATDKKETLPNRALYYLINSPTKSSSRWQVWHDWYASYANHHDVVLVEKAMPTITHSPTKNAVARELQPAVFQRQKLKVPCYSSFSHWQRMQQNPSDLTWSLDEEVAMMLDDSAQVDDVDSGITQDVRNLFTFPKGPQSGLCWHAMLEKLNFRDSAQKALHMIEKLLGDYGFELEWQETMITMLEQARLCHLETDSIVKLADIPVTQRMAEMRFLTAPLVFNANCLNKLFPNRWHQSIHQRIEQIPQGTLNAYFKGFVDMVALVNQDVYIIDYKSNHLGNQLSDYKQPALDQAMAEHDYLLQALLYAVALRRYLKTRQIEPQQYKIRYLFLRGLQKNSHHGIWATTLSEMELATLDQAWLAS